MLKKNTAFRSQTSYYMDQFSEIFDIPETSPVQKTVGSGSSFGATFVIDKNVSMADRLERVHSFVGNTKSCARRPFVIQAAVTKNIYCFI